MAGVSDLHVDLVAPSFSLNLSAHAQQLRRNFMNTTPIEELLDEHEAHGITPQFAFGHGLSYSTVVHDGLALDRYTLQPGEKLTVTLTH
jgi:hypothetical protein